MKQVDIQKYFFYMQYLEHMKGGSNALQKLTDSKAASPSANRSKPMAMKKPIMNNVQKGLSPSGSGSQPLQTPKKITSQQIQKVVNQRTMHGKKEFKIIWKGLTINEATWEQEDKMDCKDKIEEFYQHYRDVLRRKAEKKAAEEQLQSQASNVTQSQKNLPIPNRTIPSPVATEKPLQASNKVEVPTQKSSDYPKSSRDQNGNLTLSKNSGFGEPKMIQLEDTETEESKAQNPIQSRNHALLNEFKSKQNSKRLNSVQNIPIEIKLKTTEFVPQVQPLKTAIEPLKLTDTKHSNGVEPKKHSSISKQIQIAIQEESKSKVRYSQYVPQSERIDIEEVLSFRMTNSRQCSPMFFMVKNKYSEGVSVVERERLITEDPEKLIEFYERMITQRQKSLQNQ